MIGIEYHIGLELTAGHCVFSQPLLAPLCRGVSV